MIVSPKAMMEKTAPSSSVATSLDRAPLEDVNTTLDPDETTRAEKLAAVLFIEYDGLSQNHMEYYEKNEVEL
ncbi:hypothetical protein SK128_006180 [Halocaridina rubra]|uniref:Uncharacterized protein n=1 Tax=Halocaridina rubra TaxID=373956 RepID=A0AAN8WW78_HALRR